MDFTSTKVSEVFVGGIRGNSLITLILCVIAAKYINGVLQWLASWLLFLYWPMNYELDMTTKNYCKKVAEVDNTLATQSTLQDIEELIRHRVQINGSNAEKQQQLYPNGWLPLMESAKVRVGQIKRAMILGRDVIVSRSMEGKVSVLDAYCPHMGVHIGIGGQVVDVGGESCVQCPFHGWTYRMTDGQCVRIPYLNRKSTHNNLQTEKCDLIPKQAKLNAWQCCEVDNFIYIWYHIDNQPPSWSIDPTPELAPGRWVLVGRSCHKSNLDSSDMLENGADMHHFEGIHNDLFIFGGDLMKVQLFSYLQKYFKHCWNPKWRPVLDDEGRMTHKAEVYLDSWIKFFQFEIFSIEVRATQIGPASVTLRYHSNWYGPGVIKMNAIRLGGRQTMYVQHIYTQNILFNKLMARCVLYGEVKQLERDLLMWNHRKYSKNPVLVPEDKVIKRFRQWYAQFYKRKCKIVIEAVDNCSNSEL